MNEQRTVFPHPPSPSPAPPPTPPPTPPPSPLPPPTAEATARAAEHLPHPVALFAVAATTGIVAALAVGFGVGALVVGAGNSNCSPNDGWCELGAAVVGALVGAAAGIVAYIVGGVTTIVRCRPNGARSRFVIAHLLLPVATLVVSSATGALLG